MELGLLLQERLSSNEYQMRSNPLTLSKYQPNFADPRVKARVGCVLLFCKPMLLDRRAKPISSAVLTKVFGNQKSALSARLRQRLLQQEGTYKPGTVSYSYVLKRQGYVALAAAIGQTVNGDADVARELYGAIASGLEVPQYTEPTIGARRYHAVQNLPKALRAEVFKGWFDYDIEAAAPTLVYQLACKIYRSLYPTKDIAPYPSIAKLVLDRASVRQHTADVAGIDIQEAKEVIVALFFCAKLVPHEKQAIFRLLNRDRSVMDRLKADPFLRSFRREASSMWRTVLSHENVRNGLASFNGEPVVLKAATKGGQRMAIYLRLERQIIDSIEAMLRADGCVPILIHDGFMMPHKVDRAKIERAVEATTGFVVRLAEAHVGMREENFGEVHGES